MKSLYCYKIIVILWFNFWKTLSIHKTANIVLSAINSIINLSEVNFIYDKTYIDSIKLVTSDQFIIF